MIQNRYHFPVIDSTNKKAKELAQDGAPHGTLVTADCQEAGVGRRGRGWSSEKDTGIYMSMILRPKIEVEQASMLTLVAALAVKQGIQSQIPEASYQMEIKWPNDIVLNKKKVCGILTELSLDKGQIDYIVLGIGINVSNQSFPEDIAQTASSILLETGCQIEKEDLVQSIWQAFADYYKVFLDTKDLCMLRQEYEAALVNKNEKVRVLDPAGEYEGLARGISEIGELLVETESGIKKVSTGEVSVRGIYGYV